MIKVYINWWCRLWANLMWVSEEKRLEFCFKTHCSLSSFADIQSWMCRSAKRRRQDIKFVDQVLVKAIVVPEAGDLVLKAGRFTSRRRKGVGSKSIADFWCRKHWYIQVKNVCMWNKKRSGKISILRAMIELERSSFIC